MTKPKGRTHRSRGKRQPEKLWSWRTVGLVIVVLLGTAAVGLFAATVIVTLDSVQEWAP